MFWRVLQSHQQAVRITQRKLVPPVDGFVKAAGTCSIK